MNFSKSQSGKKDSAEIPNHVAIIMDGNGRWAQKRLLNRVKGHEKGAETVRTIVRTCRRVGIRYLTLYAFSTENWQRPAAEIKALMTLLKRFLVNEEKELIENNIRLHIIGQPHRLPEDVRAVIDRVKAATAQNDGLLLSLALSYGGRTELTEMVQAIATKAAAGTISPEQVSEEVIAQHLYTRDMPDPDLMIRTSGEMRISNFLLWQLAYAEFFITPTLWPDFSEKELLSILEDYKNRDRRYGKVKQNPDP